MHLCLLVVWAVLVGSGRAFFGIPTSIAVPAVHCIVEVGYDGIGDVVASAYGAIEGVEVRRVLRNGSALVFRRASRDFKCLVEPPVRREWEAGVEVAGGVEEVLVAVGGVCGVGVGEFGRILEALEADLGGRGEGEVGGVCEEVDVSGWDGERFFREVVLRHRPVLLRGSGVEKWRARERWHWDRLEGLVGAEEEVHVKAGDEGVYEGVEDAGLWGFGGVEGVVEPSMPPAVRDALYPFRHLVAVRPAPLNVKWSTFLSHLRSQNHSSPLPDSLYLEYTHVEGSFSSLLADTPPLRIMQPGWMQEGKPHVWVGDGNTLGAMHFDEFDNILAPIRGSKHLTLLHPYENANIGETHLREATLHWNPFQRQLERKKSNVGQSTAIVIAPFNLSTSNNLPTVQCNVSPGEALFLPSFWWHQVQSTPEPIPKNAAHPAPPSIALNFWFAPAFHKPFPCPTCPLTPNSKKYAKKFAKAGKRPRKENAGR